jgi:hypothetical protein
LSSSEVTGSLLVQLLRCCRHVLMFFIFLSVEKLLLGEFFGGLINKGLKTLNL